MKSSSVRLPKAPPMPHPVEEVSNWGAIAVAQEGDCVGVLSDLHVPFHDAPAVSAALDDLQRRKCNVILLNGDVVDFYSVSRYEVDPSRRDLGREIEQGRQMLGHIRARFPKARIIYKVGNHEERWKSFLIQNGAELLRLSEFELPGVLHFDEHGIQCVDDRRAIEVGRLIVLHGHEYRFAIANPVNAARGLFLRTKQSALCGHFHQRSEHGSRTVSGDTISTWSVGCLCHLNPQYMPYNEWSHGYAVVEVGENGTYYVHNKRIIKGKVY